MTIGPRFVAMKRAEKDTLAAGGMSTPRAHRYIGRRILMSHSRSHKSWSIVFTEKPRNPVVVGGNGRPDEPLR